MDLSSSEMGLVLGCCKNRNEPSGSYKAGNLLAAGTAIKIVLQSSASVCLSVCLSICLSVCLSVCVCDYNSDDEQVATGLRLLHCFIHIILIYMRVGTLIVATIYLQLIQNRYMFRGFTVLQCSHQHCVQPVASDVEVVGYL